VLSTHTGGTRDEDVGDGGHEEEAREDPERRERGR